MATEYRSFYIKIKKELQRTPLFFVFIWL